MSGFWTRQIPRHFCLEDEGFEEKKPPEPLVLSILLDVLGPTSTNIKIDIAGTQIFVRLFGSTNGQNRKYNRHTNIDVPTHKHRRLVSESESHSWMGPKYQFKVIWGSLGSARYRHQSRGPARGRKLGPDPRSQKYWRGQFCWNVTFSNTSIGNAVPVQGFSSKVWKDVLPLQWRDLCALKW